MKNIKSQSLCLIFLLLFCISLNSCKFAENILQGTSEVDFSVPHKVQVTYNEHIYDTTVVFKDSWLEINFNNEKDLLDGAYVSINENEYKINYKDMVFEGATSDLTQSFLPCVLYSLLVSFEQPVVPDSFDKERGCYYIKKNINGRFVTLECYKKDETELYSIEIK